MEANFRNKGSGPLAALLITAAMCVILLAAGGSLALFTDITDPAVNHFTVGNTRIQVNEPQYLENANEHSAVKPGVEFSKDPYIENTGSIPAYVFMKVTIPKADVMTYSQNGQTKNASAVTQLFTLMDEDSGDGTNTGWTLLSSDTTSESANVYVYVYGSASNCTRLASGAQTAKPLFSYARLANVLEGQGLDDSAQNIIIDAYSIQADGLSYTDPQQIWTFLNSQIVTED